MEVQPIEDNVYQHLEFTLAQYDINGTFLGYTELAEQFFICPSDFGDVSTMRSFGV